MMPLPGDLTPIEPDIILKFCGSKIAALRASERLSQRELAQMAGIDRSYLSEIECGLKNLSVLSLIRIAEALDVQPSDLIVPRRKPAKPRRKASRKRR